jgi:hypothetical protein
VIRAAAELVPPAAEPSGGDLAGAVRQLRARGLLTAADVVERGVRAVDRSRSHPVVLVELAGRPAYVVKMLAEGGDGVQGSPRREVAAYALAGRWSSLRSLLSRWYDADFDRRHLILDAAADETVLDRLLATGMRDTAPLGRLGDAIGTWHRETRDAADFAPLRPWVLDALGAGRPRFLDSNKGTRAFLDGLAHRDELAASLDFVGRSWTAGAVVHGDLRLDNCLLGPGPAGNVVLIDWEVAGRGDPTWDVACVVQELLTLTGANSAASAAATIRPALRTFLAGYAAAGTIVPDKLGSWVAARLLQRAIQVAAWNPEGTVPESRRLVGLALGVAGGGTDAALLPPS